MRVFKLAVICGFFAAACVFAASFINQTSPVSAAGTQLPASPEPIRVNGSQPLIPPSHLQLSGEVTGLLPGAALTVTAYVGGQAFSAHVQGRSYTVDVGRPDDSQMVVVEARADRAHYRSAIGSAHRLRALAGSDSQLVLPEHSSLRVSPYSSALAWRVRFVLGGRDAASDTEFEQALRSVATDELSIIAYTLAAISTGDLPLPAGYATGYELLQHRDAFRSFVQQSGAGSAASRYLFDQDDSAPVLSAAELGEKLVLLSGIPFNEVPTQVADINLLERLPDGGFNLHQSQPTREPKYSLALGNSGAIELHPVGAAERIYEHSNPSTRLMLRASDGHTLRRLTKGQHVSLWVLQSRWAVHDLWNPEETPLPVIEYRVLSSASLDDWARPDGWSGLLANRQWTQPWVCLQPTGAFQLEQLAVCDYVRHDFRINPYTRAGATVGHGWSVDPQGQPMSPTGAQAFQWNNVSNTTLTVSTDRVHTDFWRIKMGGTAAVPTVFLARASGGNAEGSTMVGLSLSLLHLPDYPPQLQPLGEWVMGAALNVAPRYLGDVLNISVSRQSGGTGWYRTRAEGVETQRNLVWYTSGDGFYDSRPQAVWSGGAPQSVDGCLPAMAAGAISCINQIRFFRPLSVTLGRYYGIEEQYQITHRAAGVGPGAMQVHRTLAYPSYQTCESGACLPIFNYPLTPASSMAAPIPRLDGSAGAMGYRTASGIGWLAWLLPDLDPDDERQHRSEDPGADVFGAWRLLFSGELARGEHGVPEQVPPAGGCVDSDCSGDSGRSSDMDASVSEPGAQLDIQAGAAEQPFLAEHVR